MAPKPQENITSVTDDNKYDDRGYVNNAFENEKPALPCIISTIGTNNNKDMLPTEPSNVSMDFDDLLPHIGDFGLYQKILFLLMIPFAFFVAFVYFSQIFMTLVPEKHWCRVPELEHLSVEDRLTLAIPLLSDGRSKCSMYAVNFTEALANGTKIADQSWPTQPCKYGWEFDSTEIPYSTIATELEWVCDNSALPAIAQSVFFCGAIIGGLLFGWIADRFGRIPSLCGCNLLGFVAGVATAFTGTFWSFTFCRFLVGFAFDNCFTMMYILVLEYVGPKWRTFVANMSIALFFTFAACILPWIAILCNDWKLLAIVTSAPLLLAIFTPLVVPESARWLVSQGKVDRAIGILKKFERINGKTIQPQIYKDFADSCNKLHEEDASHSQHSVLDLFKTPRLRNITILLIVIWMAISLVFDGHVRNVGALGLDVFVTFTVAAATECPADVFLTFTLDRWGRRWLAFGTMVLSGIFSILATFFPFGLYSAILAILGRFCVNISYNIGMQYAAEILPTVVRAQGVAFIHIMGYVASIVAPFVVHLGAVAPQLPLLILGVVGVVGGILCLFLPETLDRELPQTLRDGEEFGRDQKMWDFPCIARSSTRVVQKKLHKMYKRYLEPNPSNLCANPTKYITKKLKLDAMLPPKSFGNNPPKNGVDILNESEKCVQGGCETTLDVPSQEYSLDPNDVSESESVCSFSAAEHEQVEEPGIVEFDDFFSSINEELIHPNLKCQTADAIIMILDFFLQNRLTWVALEQLLKLFHAVLGDESLLPKTNYFFKKILGDYKQSAVFHFFCKNCELYIDTFENIKQFEDSLSEQEKNTMKCSNCQHSFSLRKMNDGNFFIQLPLRDQLCKKLAEAPEILCYDTSPNSNNVIGDVFDGELYKELKQKIGDKKLITLTMNTDGVKVFKSKGKASLWPIQVFINEVPIQKRFKRENIILTGIWFGKSLNASLYLKPFTDDLDDLEENKIQVNDNANTYDLIVRGFLMSADTTAKCKLLTIKQFNGGNGCPYCLHPGNVTDDPKNRKYHVTSNAYPLRTHSSIISSMEQFSTTGEVSLGVKGISPLIAIKDYDLIRGTVIDYMHCVLLGVVSLLLSLWLDSKNHFENYYITPRRAEVINKNLKFINPLRSFSRHPRSTEDRGYWKANEFRNWLLYYAIPCLNGTLKDIYLKHFVLLSEAIFILLKTSISASELSKASRNLKEFVYRFQSLYGKENMMFNVHLLEHLAKCVNDCGPLWAYSNFNFESNNGLLVKFVKGTTDVEQQIATKYGYNIALDGFKRKRNNARNYIDRINSNRVKYSKKIGVTTLLGKPKSEKLGSDEKCILKEERIIGYKKFFYMNDVFYSTSYGQAKRTNDTVVLLKDGSYGQINRIYENNGTVNLLIKRFDIEATQFLPIQMKKVSNISGGFQNVPVHQVSEKCILISTAKDMYISRLPNRIESD